MSLALWSLERKCSETAVGLEMLGFCQQVYDVR